jgi:hypothetical protein
LVVAVRLLAAGSAARAVVDPVEIHSVADAEAPAAAVVEAPAAVAVVSAQRTNRPGSAEWIPGHTRRKDAEVGKTPTQGGRNIP